MLESLGKYRIDAMLGKGAMGVVYMAFDPHIERIVALKTIRKDLLKDSADAGLIARFKNEAQAAGRLNHPNIVAVYEYGESADTAYIAMEFVQSTPLGALLAAGRLHPRASVMAWMTQLLKALDYAHGKGVVHRDIKPDNLLIDRDGQLKITDFGIARIEASTLTQAGMMVGTPCYMSPEQFRGERADRRSDVFAVGVLLYQMLTGARPFVGNSFEIMHQITHGDVRLPSQQYPALGTRYDAVVSRAMAREADARFESAQAMLDALLAVWQEEVAAGKKPASRQDDAHDKTALYMPPPAASVTEGADASAASLGGVHAASATVPPGAAGSAMLAAANLSGTPLPGATSLTGMVAAEPWKQEVAPELESILMTHVGPMARLFLKKSVAQAENLDQLCDSLLQHIPTDKARADFNVGVQKLKKKWQATNSSASSAMSSGTRSGALSGTGGGATSISGGAAAQTGLVSTESGPLLDAASLIACEQRLTALIGPIAKIVCKRAAAKTQQLHEFYRLVATNVENEAERSQFLRDCGLN